MKKTILAISMAASVLALSACTNDKASDDEVLVATKVGDITKEDLYTEMKDALGAQVMENLILMRAIESEYKVSDKELKEEIDKEKEAYGDSFDLYLQQNGITEKFFEKNIKSKMLQQKLIDSLEVSDEAIKTGVERAQTELHARHILVKDEKTAEDIIKKLKDGEDFEKLAKEFSTEPVAQETGGDLGWFGQGKMVQEFEDAAYALKKGEISEPVKTSFGYHVIELLDTRKAETEKTEEDIRAEVENNLKGIEFEEKLTDLLKKADIDVKADEFKHVMDPYLPADDKKDTDKDADKESK
ncbi:peptidylprolyl isomerase [Sporosarcina sp. USHLN248]|uniref:peptidylprolyl isomerase n=1 Tax=Sporosarcina sp. USHLN248 TaxID=3081300 RepID=UPI003016B316